MEKKKKKQNRNSIVRIILSNYDSKGIKEFKVLYKKQGGVDTFWVKTSIDEENNLEINTIKYKKNNNKYKCDFTFLDKNQILIMKKEKETNRVTRKYIITLEVSLKNSQIIIGKVKIPMNVRAIPITKKQLKIEKFIKNNKDLKIRKIGRFKSQTERKLLPKDICEKYGEIARCIPDKIDSLKIYKIRKFLNYRSNMLLYFSLINNFLCNSLDKNQIIDIKFKEHGESLVDYIYNNINEEITNRENNRQKRISKNNNKIAIYKNNLEDSVLSKTAKNDLKRSIEHLKKQNIELGKKAIKFLSKEKLEEDLIKIMDVFKKLRHSIMHYDYSYFENLFENQENKELEKKLDLNIFKEFPLLNEMKIESKNNHLDSEDTIYILGKTRKAENIYTYYHGLCQSKNGFKGFINSFFFSDGEERKEFKEKIDKHFQEEIKFLENYLLKDNLTDRDKKKYKKILDKFKFQWETMGTAYVTDIHESKKYKELYNLHKEEVIKYMKLLNGSKDVNGLRNCNKNLTELKNKMDIITKNNFLIKLKYKMQIAFGFLYKNFDGDLDEFRKFDPTNEKELKDYLNNAQTYLNFKIPKADKNAEKTLKNFDSNKMKEALEKIISQQKIDFSKEDKKNNLFKFYILIYLFLPREFRGDFLGFIKNHYYDIKNIPYEENREQDDFFHKIRLFEKNVRNYEVIKYSVSAQEYLKYLNLDSELFFEKRGTQQIEIFNKNIILPIFKYYGIIFKLYNDIELCGLFTIAEKKNYSLEEAIEESKEKYKSGSFLNFSKILENIKSKKYKNLSIIRNGIAHFNSDELLNNLLLNKEDKNNKIYILNDEVRKIIEFSKNNKLEEIGLGINFINDFYMKKEQFMVGQGIQARKEEEEDRKENEKLKNYNINLRTIKDYHNFIKKLEELVEFPEKISSSSLIKNFSKVSSNRISIKEKIKIIIEDASFFRGIYKKKVVKLLKEELIKKIIYNEDKMVNIHVVDYINKKDKIIDVFLTRKGNTNEFEKDISKYNKEEREIINSSEVNIDKINCNYLFKYTFKRKFFTKK